MILEFPLLSSGEELLVLDREPGHMPDTSTLPSGTVFLPNDLRGKTNQIRFCDCSDGGVKLKNLLACQPVHSDPKSSFTDSGLQEVSVGSTVALPGLELAPALPTTGWLLACCAQVYLLSAPLLQSAPVWRGLAGDWKATQACTCC